MEDPGPCDYHTSGISRYRVRATNSLYVLGNAVDRSCSSTRIRYNWRPKIPSATIKYVMRGSLKAIPNIMRLSAKYIGWRNHRYGPVTTSDRASGTIEKFDPRLARAPTASAAPATVIRRPNWIERTDPSHTTGPVGRRPTPTRIKLALSEATMTRARPSRNRGFLLVQRTTAAANTNAP